MPFHGTLSAPRAPLVAPHLIYIKLWFSAVLFPAGVDRELLKHKDPVTPIRVGLTLSQRLCVNERQMDEPGPGG